MDRFMKIMSYLLTAAVGFAAAVIVFVYVGLIPVDPGFSKLEELQQLIEQRFIGQVDPTAMQDAAADAMVNSLGDRWSQYIPAESYGDYMEQMANAYVGVGITVSVREDGQGVNVTQVYAGGPAEEAGLKPGDVIIKVDGQGFDASDLTDVSSRVKGNAGTTVDLTILREGNETVFTVERREIQMTVAAGEMLTDTIGLVTITNFDARCAQETIAAIEQVRAAGAEALIFDVRNNPGGYKDEMVEVLDYLLPEGPLFRSEDYLGNSFVDSSDKRCLDIPMAVLVNSESYSAAEFFAAALSEYEAAEIVGEKTCGKGYFQQAFTLWDGSAVNLSIGKYYTPNGISLADIGITPDVEVSVDEETFLAIYADTLAPEEDPQIQAAIELLQAG